MSAPAPLANAPAPAAMVVPPGRQCENCGNAVTRALLRRLRAALGGSGALPVALLADCHRGPDARGLAGVAHTVGAVVQAGIPDERIPRRPSGALLAAGTAVPGALRGLLPGGERGRPTRLAVVQFDRRQGRRHPRGVARASLEEPPGPEIQGERDRAAARRSAVSGCELQRARGRACCSRSRGRAATRPSSTTAASCSRRSCTTCRAPCSSSCRCSRAS